MATRHQRSTKIMQRILDVISETALVPEDQKVTNAPFFLVESQKRIRELCAGNPWIFSRHVIYKLW